MANDGPDGYEVVDVTPGNRNAFPLAVPGLVYADGSHESPYIADKGLTKRELFAAMAMQGQIACDEVADATPETVAEWARKFADALLAELDKTEEATDADNRRTT